MRLSLSPFVRLFVCPSPFFSLSVLGVLSCPKEFQWCFKKVLRVFEVSMVLQVSFKSVYKKFYGSLKGVSRKSKGCFKEVSGKFQGCFKKDSRIFQVSFKGVYKKF